MKSHWSCSKIADWIRGTPKPFAGTVKEWNEWEKVAKMKSLRYWLATVIEKKPNVMNAMHSSIVSQEVVVQAQVFPFHMQYLN